MESSASLPNKLCIHCMSKILDIIQFIQLCKDADSKWKHMIEQLTLPTIAKPSLFVVVSSDCQKRELLNFTKKNIKDNKEALKVLKQRLIWNKFSIIRREKKKQLKLSNDMNMSCPECDKVFYNIGDFNKHLKNLKKKMCPHCNIILDLVAYKSHAGTHNSTVYSCDICHECFVHKNSFLMHKSKHSRGKHICHECKLSFSNIQKLTSHLVKHEHCVCSTCKKTFTNKSCFRNHKKVCAQCKDIGEAKFICDYCLRAHNNKSALKLHIQTKHMKEMKFQCDKCGKSFLSKAHLEEHGNTHEKVSDRFVCKCGSKYSTRRGYQRHVTKKHSTEDEIHKPQDSKANDPFRCEQCKDTFTNGKDFYKHIRCHHSKVEAECEDEPTMEIEVITIKHGCIKHQIDFCRE